MSYIIEPMPLISFVEDTNMKLPRFQRKATWDKKQNFELCISVFQDYPVGVVIVNKEQNVSWLLDGRQRRNALKIMRDNPVEVYEWARAYIGFKRNDDIGVITKNYWNEVDKYLQKEDKTVNAESDNDLNSYDDSDEDTVISSFDSERQKQGLKTLLDLVLMVHQITKNVSRWEKLFDFKDYCANIKYELKRENYKINPVKLRHFLLDLGKSDSDITEDEFITYYDDNATIISGQEIKFKQEVNRNWDSIKSSINTILKAEKVFEDARIGVITLNNVSPLDAQNIFSRINRGGTQLKAEELLSAKPFWNEIVNKVDAETTHLVSDLYRKMGVEEPNGIVRWDLAATLISRLDKKCLIFDSTVSSNDDTIAMDQVILGFKLISAIKADGMSAKSVSAIETKNINWDTDIDEMVDDINTICNILMDDDFFKYYQMWKKPITKLLGNAISLEFIAILLKNWKGRGKPTSGAEYKAFQREARILFDRLVFEYSTKVWRGSGDSKMASDIKNWNERVKSIADTEWINFIDNAIGGSYNGQPVTQKTMTPILYYYYALNEKRPVFSTSETIEVDHIIPQEKFAGNDRVNQSMKDSLSNLALLPKNDNASKKSKALNEITDSWLKSQIVEFEGIPESDFAKYSDITNIDALKELRGESFKNTFNGKRQTVLSN